jgi:hypothetical protein
MPKNMVTRSMGAMLILRESDEPPSDEEWDECLRLLAPYRSDFSRVKVLVVTDGGGPTPVQRKRLSSVLDGNVVRVAVVSESVKVRFITSSVALFLRRISSFRRHELQDAYTFLSMTPEERLAADRAIADMDAEIKAPTQYNTLRPRP